MAAAGSHTGGCPVPFLDKSTFADSSSQGGNLAGRLCMNITSTLDCCLPCPATDWVYATIFSTIGLACTAFLLISWIILPPDKSHRHAFGVCISIGIALISLAFVIPMGSNPRPCLDEITPNDMHSGLMCAFSGSLVVAGAITVPIWVLVRAISMHLQVCWSFVPGKIFSIGTQLISWTLAVSLFILNMSVTGVSYRFGPTCHINAHRALSNYWAPLLTLSGAAALFTFVTFGYCIFIYVKYRCVESSSPIEQTYRPSSRATSRHSSALLVYRRTAKVLWLQWRSICIILLLLLDLIIYSTVFVKLDNVISAATRGTETGRARVMPFLQCLVDNHGDRSFCFEVAGKVLVNENTAVAIAMLISLAGIECLVLLARRSMFTAWYDCFIRTWRAGDEFVSVGALVETTRSATLPLKRRKGSVVEMFALELQPKSLDCGASDKAETDDTASTKVAKPFEA